MKTNRLIEQCKKAKAAGYIYISSVVKSVYSTTYYNVQLIDDVIKAGKWIAAPYNSYGWHGRIGQSQRPDKTIAKTMLYNL